MAPSPSVGPTWYDRPALLKVLQLMSYPAQYAAEIADRMIDLLDGSHAKGFQMAREGRPVNRDTAARWYSRYEFVDLLRRMRYGVCIREELADWMAFHCRAAMCVGASRARRTSV